MISVASSGVMSPCLTASYTSAINAGSSLQEQLGSPQKGCSVVWRMGSSIRTRKGWCCFCIVCTPLDTCSHDAIHPRIRYNHRENQRCLTNNWFSNRWHDVGRRRASKRSKTVLRRRTTSKNLQETHRQGCSATTRYVT